MNGKNLEAALRLYKERDVLLKSIESIEQWKKQDFLKSHNASLSLGPHTIVVFDRDEDINAVLDFATGQIRSRIVSIVEAMAGLGVTVTE